MLLHLLVLLICFYSCASHSIMHIR